MADEPDDLSVPDTDPWRVMKEMREDTRVPPDVLATFESAFAAFERLHQAFAHDEQALGAFEHVFDYGAVFGAYLSEMNPGLLESIRQKLNSFAGKKSGEKRGVRPWHQPATELARTLRKDKPRLTQEQLAEILAQQLKRILPERKDRVGVDTLKDFVSKLEREGKLSRRSSLGG